MVEGNDSFFILFGNSQSLILNSFQLVEEKELKEEMGKQFIKILSFFLTISFSQQFQGVTLTHQEVGEEMEEMVKIKINIFHSKI